MLVPWAGARAFTLMDCRSRSFSSAGTFQAANGLGSGQVEFPATAFAYPHKRVRRRVGLVHSKAHAAHGLICVE